MILEQGLAEGYNYTDIPLLTGNFINATHIQVAMYVSYRRISQRADNPRGGVDYHTYLICIILKNTLIVFLWTNIPGN